MATISVVYHTGTGKTRVLAEAIARGAKQHPDAKVHLLEIKHTHITNGRWHDEQILQILNDSDAIIFGCPTWMGSVSSVFKSFLEKAFDVWLVQGWKDKIGACFTNSASQSGDKLSTLYQLTIFGMQMGMIWVGVGDPPLNNWSGGGPHETNRLGSWMGVMGQSNRDQGTDLAPSTGDRRTAERLGLRVASIASHFIGETKHQTDRIHATSQNVGRAFEPAACFLSRLSRWVT
jgi:multimeric flavodoxin WrbA